MTKIVVMYIKEINIVYKVQCAAENPEGFPKKFIDFSPYCVTVITEEFNT
jgi:hypothetical protein